MVRLRTHQWFVTHGRDPPMPPLHPTVLSLIDQWFKLVDVDESRTLEHSELMTALKAAKVPCSDQTIKEMMVLMDANRDGVIAWDEFQRYVVNEISRGKSMLTGEYVLPSGASLPFGMMLSKLRRGKLMAELLQGELAKRRLVQVSEQPRQLAADVACITAAAHAFNRHFSTDDMPDGQVWASSALNMTDTSTSGPTQPSPRTHAADGMSQAIHMEHLLERRMRAYQPPRAWQLDSAVHAAGVVLGTAPATRHNAPRKHVLPQLHQAPMTCKSDCTAPGVARLRRRQDEQQGKQGSAHPAPCHATHDSSGSARLPQQPRHSKPLLSTEEGHWPAAAAPIGRRHKALHAGNDQRSSLSHSQPAKRLLSIHQAASAAVDTCLSSTKLPQAVPVSGGAGMGCLRRTTHPSRTCVHGSGYGFGLNHGRTPGLLADGEALGVPPEVTVSKPPAIGRHALP